MKNIAILIVGLSLIGCSHSGTQKDKTYQNMVTGLVIGAIVGSVSAPEGEKREAHALLWASTLAAGAAVYSVQKYDVSKELDSLRLRVKEAKLLGRSCTSEGVGDTLVSTISLAESLPFGSIPENIRRNIKPTQLQVKKVSEWRLGKTPNTHLFCETEVEFKASKIVK